MAWVPPNTAAVVLASIPRTSPVAPVPAGSAPQVQLTQIKNIWKKIPESPQKANLNLPLTDNYLHSIYIVLGIVSNLEMN